MLFTYRRRVEVNGAEVLNDNFINPLAVISFYWQQNEEKKKVLSVFLANNYSITFVESVGKRFVQHMEDFLRYMIAAGTPKAEYNNNSQHQHREKSARRPITAEVVDEDITQIPADPEWVAN